MEIVDPSTPMAGGKYRIDTLVTAHPDAARIPNARVGIVSVCWQEMDGRVEQVQMRRVFVP